MASNDARIPDGVIVVRQDAPLVDHEVTPQGAARAHGEPSKLRSAITTSFNDAFCHHAFAFTHLLGLATGILSIVISYHFIEAQLIREHSYAWYLAAVLGIYGIFQVIQHLITIFFALVWRSGRRGILETLLYLLVVYFIAIIVIELYLSFRGIYMLINIYMALDNVTPGAEFYCPPLLFYTGAFAFFGESVVIIIYRILKPILC